MSTETEPPPTIPHGRFADQPIEAVPKHQLQWMQAMGISVADKITALLERTDKLKRGSEISTTFDAKGQAAAQAIAAADQPPDFPIPGLFGTTAADQDATEVPSAVWEGWANDHGSLLSSAAEGANQRSSTLQ